ncbi:hypothetical protein PPL_04969 [Heterostelium album PN500]|uniref:Class II aldolase/adducin N-terminal domain-containing protein n=1 Tax=Heterostelium pallidum (strain ATCC 26659 / Pp 5 / PN500) TaxID=670386 RepID=D3B925_HETP5|nr:hypothetical protein PPL_04969 [Heterostelium album PN500]EFA82064.1 hypothetical protein PPL_04969 [Heterostelium album PN500]|eukprot:XP_020434181.1 hypothetical protein PPL_04969 [Heterostelium album PN500]
MAAMLVGLNENFDLGVAVSSMKCGLLENLCQNSMICGEVSYLDYEGISVGLDEQKHIQADLGPTAKNLILRNHGLLTLGGTIQECFLRMFFQVKACEIQVMAVSAVGGDLSKLNYGDDKYREQMLLLVLIKKLEANVAQAMLLVLCDIDNNDHF